VAENAGAVGWMLSDDDWRRLDRLGREISQRITYVTW
jgi:diketogulonate reductase-like aldo/keto reductase